MTAIEIEIVDPWVRPASVFATTSVWKYRHAVTIHLASITGGTPSDPKVAKGWLTKRLGGEGAHDALLERKVMEAMAERAGSDPDAAPVAIQEDAIEQVANNVNGFKRSLAGELFIEGRTLKSMLKENTSIGLGSGVVPARLGLTKKGAPSFIAEHLMVDEDRCLLTRDGQPITEPDDIVQSFVHTWRGNSIDYSEVVYDVDLSFTIISDVDLADLYPVVFSLAENNGLGARRSQGSGRFVTTAFDKL
jgi:hypothetical protein